LVIPTNYYSIALIETYCLKISGS